MSRDDRQRARDILEAIDAIAAAESALARLSGDEAEAALAIDAVTYRVITIGEAVKDLSVAVLDGHPDVPWSRIARMRDLLTHRYHRRDIQVIRATVDEHLEPLRLACEAIVAGHHPSR